MKFELERLTAIEAARDAGSILKSHFRQIHQVHFKGENNLVTEMDFQSENLIRSKLSKTFPKDQFLGEEGEAIDWKNGRVWIVDPLDGTVNYAHGIPIFSVSIALVIDGLPHVGVVYNPMADELFWAVKGLGAFLHKIPLKVSNCSELKDALVVTGFPYNSQSFLPPIIRQLEVMIPATRGVRRLGSAAIDLCYVSAGYFDAFWECCLHSWDIAAGYLILIEAGGWISDFSGLKMSLDRGEILACTPDIKNDLIRILSTWRDPIPKK